MEKEITSGAKAKEIHKMFSDLIGSEHIATSINLQIVIDLCNELKPVRVLELGGGIGTITYTLLENSSAIVDVYEDNSFCIDQLKKNLLSFKNRYNIINNYKLLPPARNYDLIVIDGGNGKKHDGGFADSIYYYLSYINTVKIIFVEGHRKMQSFWARKALRKKYWYSINVFKSEFEKGCSVIRCKASMSRLLKNINFIYWELRLWVMVKNYLSYKARKIKSLIWK